MNDNFFRNVIEVEVITVDAPLDDDFTLCDVEQMIAVDNPPGRINRVQVWKVDRDLASALLRQHGTVPELILGEAEDRYVINDDGLSETNAIKIIDTHDDTIVAHVVPAQASTILAHLNGSA